MTVSLLLAAMTLSAGCDNNGDVDVTSRVDSTGVTEGSTAERSPGPFTAHGFVMCIAEFTSEEGYATALARMEVPLAAGQNDLIEGVLGVHVYRSRGEIAVEFMPGVSAAVAEEVERLASGPPVDAVVPWLDQPENAECP